MSESQTVRPVKGAAVAPALHKREEAGGRKGTKSSKRRHIWSTWMKIKQWLELSRIFILVGVIIFTISQAGGSGDMAAYLWFIIGVLATWILTMRLLSVDHNPNEQGIMDIFKHVSILFPTLATLLPLAILVYVFGSLSDVLEKGRDHLPNQFFWFNRFTFFLVVLQLFFLNRYYSNESYHLIGRTGGQMADNRDRSIWVAGLILISILSSAAAIELYVIITAFLTDG